MWREDGNRVGESLASLTMRFIGLHFRIHERQKALASLAMELGSLYCHRKRLKALASLAMRFIGLHLRIHERQKALASLAVAERDILAHFVRSDRARSATR